MSDYTISSGTEIIDKLLKGGYEKDVLTTIYGPGGCGKTNLCMLCAVDVAKKKKVIYLDSEGGFSISRLKQICPDYENIIKNVTFFKPVDFAEQLDILKKLSETVDSKVGLVVVDSIATLYRLELGKKRAFYELNREFNAQLSFLSSISKNKNIPVLITNQVYSEMDEAKSIRMVGRDLIMYASKCVIELQKFHKGRRKVILKKHRSLPEGSTAVFDITETGVEEAH